MMSAVILSAVTGAGTSSQFRGPTTLGADELSGAEEVVVEIKMGSTWVDTGLKLTATEPAKEITAAGVYRAVKPATASVCGVYNIDEWS